MSRQKITAKEKEEIISKKDCNKFENWNTLYFALLQMASVVEGRAEAELAKKGLEFHHHAKMMHSQLMHGLEICKRQLSILHLDYTFKTTGGEFDLLWKDGILILQLVCLLVDRSNGDLDSLMQLKKMLLDRPSGGVFSDETILSMDRRK